MLASDLDGSPSTEVSMVTESHSPKSSATPTAVVNASLSDNEYVEKHYLPELLDLLIYQVSTVKPKHPAAYMAYLLRERIAARDGYTAEEDKAVVSTATRSETPPLNTQPVTSKNARGGGGGLEESDNFGSESTLHGENDEDWEDSTTEANFQKFGIWIHVQSSDVPLIVARFKELCREGNLEPPRAFSINTDDLLRSLSRASAIYFFRGFSEARKHIPLQPHKNAPSACYNLLRAITDVITFATVSQRRSLTAFMECLMEDLRVDDVDEMRETERAWKSVRTSHSFKSIFITKMKTQARQFDFLMEFEAFLDVFLEWVDTYVSHRDMSATQRQEMMRETYKAIPTKYSLPRLPDRFAVFCSILLCNLREAPEIADSPEKDRTLRIMTKLLLVLLEDENTIAITPLSRQPQRDGLILRVRRGDSTLVTLLTRYFSNGFRKKFADEYGSSRMTLSYFLSMRHEFNEDYCDAFLRVSEAALQVEQRVEDSETQAMRCNATSRKHLLRYFVNMIQCRDELTMDEIELGLLRSRCSGVTTGTLLVYLCDLYRLTSFPEKEVEQAKFVLSILQEICMSSNNSPVTGELAISFQLLAEAAEGPTTFVDAFSAAPPFVDIPHTLLVQFLDVHGLFHALSSVFDRQAMDTQEQYFNVCLLMATRMRVARFQPTPAFNFLCMGILSGMNGISEKVPLYSLLPACEVLAGMSPSLDLPTDCGLCRSDRQALLSFFHHHRGSRALLKAVHNFLEVLPDFRSRVMRPAISYERVQRYFYSAAMKLLGMEEGDPARDKLLRVIATDLSVEGMQKRDFDLFALSLTHALREPGFPEPAWNTFMCECVERMKEFLPKLLPLDSYKNDTQKIIKIQRHVRRIISQRKAGISATDKKLLNRLLEELSNEVLDDDEAPGTIRISYAESQLIALTWRLMDNLNRAHAIYSGVQVVCGEESTSARPPSAMFLRGRTARSGSILSVNSSHSSATNKYQAQQSVREEIKLTFKKCKNVADNMTRFIEAVCLKNKGERWVEVWEKEFDRDFQQFFDDLIAPQQFMPFAMEFIETLRRHSVVQHSTLRVIWSSFVSCFNRLALLDVDQHY